MLEPQTNTQTLTTHVGFNEWRWMEVKVSSYSFFFLGECEVSHFMQTDVD